MTMAIRETDLPTRNDRAGRTWRLAAAAALVLMSMTAVAVDPPKAAAPAAAAAPPAQAAADAAYRLPGSLNKDLSLDDLRRRFGAANVTVTDIDGAEGETFRGIVLFDGDPARRAEIFPQDDATLRGISSIRISGATSRWQLDSGVRLGMTLAELVAANGKPVSFSGLDWDYGGGISDWHGGRLAPKNDGGVFVSISLTHGELAQGDNIPTGDSDFRSDDKRYPRQGKLLYVGQIMVSFPTPDGE